jgi:two-component sensor histidine kinase
MTDPLAFLSGGGKMGALMRSFDWSKTPLGDPARWLDPLKMAVATCLASRFPMVVWWGPQLLMLYNDAWQPILGETKHPAGLGRPGEESWPETWPIVGVQFENALEGEASWSEDLLLASDRHGYIEECYFTYSHSPLRDSSGAVRGVLTAVVETTSSVLNQRRLRKLRELSDAAIRATREQRTMAECCSELVGMLCAANPDVSIALLYLRQSGGMAKLVARAGLEDDLFPLEVEAGTNDAFALARALMTGSSPIVSAVPAGLALPGGVWPEPTVELVAVPLMAADPSGEPLGVMLVGANARLRVNDDYLDYVTVVAAQCAASIGVLLGLEREKLAARTKELLIRELTHRSRNLLTLVTAISERTRAASVSLEGYGVAFNDRLSALSRVQGLLSSGEDAVVRLEDVVAIELDTLAETDRSRVIAAGPSVRLPPAGVQMLSLALHELLTNAVKHGAIGDPAGRVSIRWSTRVEPDRREFVHIEWLEEGSRLLPPDATSPGGFGRVMLERVLPGQLKARTHYERRPQGIRWTIELPLGSGRAG